ncbi:hypothetical protein HYC85_012853 [Camellia sinensis]|uniref:Uncharacterized protein n=1 Tax=Camellia sinensis TaxID=4442 RepID=A0A7J7HD58_CAMSI|nr:hypothetical protein HYC85_012853 [Camellia sinensis]
MGILGRSNYIVVCSAIVTKPNESVRLIVTTFIGVVFGFLIGASFPTLPLAKVHKVSDNLLHDASSNQETLIFCSQTLRSKVQRDFEELPSEAFRPLRDLLNISLAVAALAVHVPAKDWGDGGIVNWLRDEMNSHPECIPSFLELLRVLPEDPCFYTCFSPIAIGVDMKFKP